MEIENIPWWMWMLISLPLGWVLAYANSGPIQGVGLRADQEVEFERAVLHAPVTQDQVPWLRNLIVYPITQAVGPNGQTIPIMAVTYQVLSLKAGTDDEYQYRPSWFCARVPYATTHQRPIYNAQLNPAPRSGLPPGIEKTYVPGLKETLGSIAQAVYGHDMIADERAITLANQFFLDSHSISALIAAGKFRPGQALMIPWRPESMKTVRDWLDAAGQDCPWIHYRFAWWKVPNYCKLVWVGLTFLIVGVIWPVILRLLAGAGLAGSGSLQEEYDLSRFGKGKRKAAPAQAHHAGELSDADRHRLAALNESLTASLKEGLETTVPRPKRQDRPASPLSPKPLVAAPIGPAAAPIEQTKDEKEYKGEFYPVVRGPAEPKKETSKHP